MNILMKVTSRGRPEILLDTVKKYLELAEDTKKMFWLFSFDVDDSKYMDNQFQLTLFELIEGNGVFYTAPNKSKIEAINAGINGLPYNWDILLNISDDQIPVLKGYDNVIRNAMEGDLDRSLWFNDGWQNRINTQEIVGAKYYDRFKYLYQPEYKSFFCDNEATEVGLKLGKLKYNRICLIKHFHPAWDKKSHIKMDELYIKNNEFWKHDQDLFENRKRRGFK